MQHVELLRILMTLPIMYRK